MAEPFAKGKLMSMGPGTEQYPNPARLEVGMSVNYWHQHAIKTEFVIDGISEEYDQVRTSDIWSIN